MAGKDGGGRVDANDGSRPWDVCEIARGDRDDRIWASQWSRRGWTQVECSKQARKHRLLHPRESRHSRMQRSIPYCNTSHALALFGVAGHHGVLVRFENNLFPRLAPLGPPASPHYGRHWLVSLSNSFVAYKTCFYPPCAFRRCQSRTFRRTPSRLTNPLSLTHLLSPHRHSPLQSQISTVKRSSCQHLSSAQAPVDTTRLNSTLHTARDRRPHDQAFVHTDSQSETHSPIPTHISYT